MLANSVLFSLVATLPWVVSLGYWLLLRNQFIDETTLEDHFFSFVPHATNILITLIELFLSQNKLSKLGWVYPVIALYLYLAYSALLRYQFDIPWPYGFMATLLEGKAWMAAAFVIGGAILTIILYYISYLLVILRDWAKPKSNDLFLGTNNAANSNERTMVELRV